MGAGGRGGRFPRKARRVSPSDYCQQAKARRRRVRAIGKGTPHQADVAWGSVWDRYAMGKDYNGDKHGDDRGQEEEREYIVQQLPDVV